MINSLMISKTGMQAQQMQLDVISNNLANVSTNGFKRANAVFEDLMYQNLRQVGANSGRAGRSCPRACSWAWACAPSPPRATFSQGSLQQSDNPLDLAVNGNGFFQVEHARRHHRLHARRQRSRPTRRAGIVTSSGYPLTAGITVPADRAPASPSRPMARSPSRCRATPRRSGSARMANWPASSTRPASSRMGQNLYAESLPRRATPSTAHPTRPAWAR
jgi:flagellar basal-body rod protein FlgG